jgi:hypothetical protein
MAAALATEELVNALVAAVIRESPLPSGHASIVLGDTATVDGPGGTKIIRLAFISLGFAQCPGDDKGHPSSAGIVSLLLPATKRLARA